MDKNFILSIIFLTYSFSFFLQAKDKRDPFSLPKKQSITNVKSKKKDQIKLSCVIKIDEKFGAILVKGKQREVVFLKNKIWGYLIDDIKINSIVLAKKSIKKTLYI